jgi:hypothetical protein
VFDWAAESDPDNEVGTGYILMEKMEGKPLDWHQLTGEQKDKVLKQLVDMFLELERHPSDRIGSIMSPKSDNTHFEVQGIAHHSTFDIAEAGGQPLGPFDSSVAAARTVVEYYLDMIARGEIGVDYLEEISLAHRFRLDIIDEIWQEVRGELLPQAPGRQGRPHPCGWVVQHRGHHRLGVVHDVACWAVL